MRSLVPFMLLSLIFGLAGCSPNAKTRSEGEISLGDDKLSQVDEMQNVEASTGDDYSKMTQVDPNFKQEAMAAYDKAIQDDPKNPEAYYARGFAVLSHGENMFPAVEDFNRAIELNPKYARAYLMRGRAYEALGDTDKAKADHAKAVELEPGIDN